MIMLKKFLATIALVPLLAVASEGGFPLDHAPDGPRADLRLGLRPAQEAGLAGGTVSRRSPDRRSGQPASPVPPGRPARPARGAA